MKKITLIILLFFISSCAHENDEEYAYRIKKESYHSIVVVPAHKANKREYSLYLDSNDDTVSYSTVLALLHLKAASLTLQDGYKYFTLTDNSKQETNLLTSGGGASGRSSGYASNNFNYYANYSSTYEQEGIKTTIDRANTGNVSISLTNSPCDECYVAEVIKEELKLIPPTTTQ